MENPLFPSPAMLCYWVDAQTGTCRASAGFVFGLDPTACLHFTAIASCEKKDQPNETTYDEQAREPPDSRANRETENNQGIGPGAAFSDSGGWGIRGGL
jgi:hypothetical protein